MGDFYQLDEIPGHTEISLSEVPEADLKDYADSFKDLAPEELEQTIVWYPHISDEKWDEIYPSQRKQLLKKIELIFNISMDDYPDEDLYVWKIALFWGGRLWSPSYYVGTAGHISADSVEKYLAGTKNRRKQRLE